MSGGQGSEAVAGGVAGRPSSEGLDSSGYRAPWWLRNRHLHTIYASVVLGRALPRPPFRRERLELPDGDFIDVDWLDAPAPFQAPGVPLLVMFHGLEGSSDSHSSKAFAHMAMQRGWRFAMPHFRGCSGEPNRLPRAYHSGETSDIDWVLRNIRKPADATHETAPVYAVGVSLGGNALLKWLGERGAEAGQWVRAAASVCAPLDLTVAGPELGRGFNMVYTRMFLATLKEKSADKLARHPGIFDGEAMRRSRTLRDFDDAVTAPLHGFRDAEDYWARASSAPLLSRISVPALVLNARDDPFVPESALPDPRTLPANVTLELPPHGGHVGFVHGGFPGRIDWLPERVFRFFAELR